MAVNGVSNPAAAAPAQTDSTALGRTRLAESFDTFLTLLTTQMKNQDPLSPLDSNQFTQQIVQMTGVEQQLAGNDLLKQLVANTSGGIATAVSMIGKEVRAVSDSAGLSGGKASWSYSLDTAARDVKLEVLDAKGNVINVSAATDNAAGEHAYSWNGKDINGVQLADGGEYTLRVTAKDATGATVASTTFIKGVVSSVEQSNGDTLLNIGGAKVPWGHVTSITQPGSATSTASSGSTSPNATPSNQDGQTSSAAA